MIVVDDGRRPADWAGMGVDAVLADPFDRADLLSVLLGYAPPIDGPAGDASGRTAPPPAGWRGRLVAITGPGGAGTSTLAMGLAQGLGSAPRHQGLVVLADLALHADQGVLHDAGDVMPGLQELVEAHRLDLPAVDEVRSHVFDTGDRGYDLLLGLRRHRDWPVLRPRAVQASLDGLLRSYRLVVADLDPDLEGDDEVGSLDVEERNVLARTAAGRADLVLVVAPPTVVGLRRLVLILDEWHRGGVGAERLLAVINRAPRRAMARSEITGAIASLLAGMRPELAETMASPVFVIERRGIDQLHRAAMGLPAALVRPLTDTVEAVLERTGPRVVLDAPAEGLTPITPGSLGAWADDEALG